MDSMRSLNTSLPRARKAPQPDIHQAFRTAALTVTNLYKSAIADLDKSRQEGYQEALEDLLGFLDKQNVGVSDGEGWRIRQWATERIEGGHPNSDTDEEGAAEEKRARSSSPMMERNASAEETQPAEQTVTVDASPIRSESAPATAQPEESPDTEMNNPPMFHFSSSTPYPNFDPNEGVPVRDPQAAAHRTFGAARRAAHANRAARARNAAQSLFSLGSGAGQKRKMLDLFNVDFNDGRRDGHGGGPKRGRMS